MATRRVLPYQQHQTDLIDYECPICTEYLWPPVYKCKNGHSLCKSCIQRVHMCPICRENLPFPKMRSYALEADLTRILFPCEFSIEGCTARVKLNQLEDHKELCRFRTGRRCAPLGFPNCQAMVSLQGLIHHAQNAHEIPCLPVDLFQEFDIEQIIISSTAINAQNFARVNWKPVLISLKATAHIFQLRTTFDSAAGDSKIKWAIQDRSEPAGDYVAVMSLVKDSSRIYCETWTWTGPILKFTDGNSRENRNRPWFTLPSKLVAGRSHWKLRLCIRPGKLMSAAVLPTCIAVNEMSGAQDEVSRSGAAGANSAAEGAELTHAANLTCAGGCGQIPTDVPRILRPVCTQKFIRSVLNTVPYCRNCFNDCGGSSGAQFFFRTPRDAQELRSELRRFESKVGIYEEHFYIIPPCRGYWFALRRLVGLVTAAGWEGVVCHGCNARILSWRFQCTECPNLDFCRRCYLEERKHEEHTVLIIPPCRLRFLLRQRLIWRLALPYILICLCLITLASTNGVPVAVTVLWYFPLLCMLLLIIL